MACKAVFEAYTVFSRRGGRKSANIKKKTFNHSSSFFTCLWKAPVLLQGDVQGRRSLLALRWHMLFKCQTLLPSLSLFSGHSRCHFMQTAKEKSQQNRSRSTGAQRPSCALWTTLQSLRGVSSPSVWIHRERAGILVSKHSESGGALTAQWDTRCDLCSRSNAPPRHLDTWQMHWKRNRERFTAAGRITWLKIHEGMETVSDSVWLLLVKLLLRFPFIVSEIASFSSYSFVTASSYVHRLCVGCKCSWILRMRHY